MAELPTCQGQGCAGASRENNPLLEEGQGREDGEEMMTKPKPKPKHRHNWCMQHAGSSSEARSRPQRSKFQGSQNGIQDHPVSDLEVVDNLLLTAAAVAPAVSCPVALLGRIKPSWLRFVGHHCKTPLVSLHELL